MSEQYLPRNKDTSTVVIERAAAEAIDPEAAALLRASSWAEVTGVKYWQEDYDKFVVSIDAEPVKICASSLRLRSRDTLPWWLPFDVDETFPALTVYDETIDRYVNYLALPHYQFSLRRFVSAPLSPEEMYEKLPDVLRPTHSWQPEMKPALIPATPA